MTPLPRPVWPGGAVVTGPVHAELGERRQPRRITQICAMSETLYALCDDGTVWERTGGSWAPEPAIPQRQIAEGDL